MNGRRAIALHRIAGWVESNPTMTKWTYAKAGVDVDAGDRVVDAYHADVVRTFGPRVLGGKGGFAGLFSLDYDRRLFARNYKHPVLAAATDGVGTKLDIAQLAGRHRVVGIDLVAMCVNDLAVVGAEPLFFLDYVATGKINERVLPDVVAGIADGCVQAGAALIGGETAEMPDFYRKDQYDLAGFAVGVVEKSRILTGEGIEPGDVILGLESTGLHSNGFSLVRKVLLPNRRKDLDKVYPEVGITLEGELLRPTRIYVNSLLKLLGNYKIKRVVKAFAHITGGGLPGNVVRVLPEGCRAEIAVGRWPIPPIFDVIARTGDVEEAEMFRTFNMGIGMVVVMAPHFAHSAAKTLRRSGEKVHVIGRIVAGKRTVKLVKR